MRIFADRDARSNTRHMAFLDGTTVVTQVTRDELLVEETREPHGTKMGAKWALDRCCHRWLEQGFVAVTTQAETADPDDGALSHTTFIEALRADPEDLETHMVFGDWLSARGEPWGQLIALQCARDQLPRFGATAQREAFDRQEAMLLFEHASALWGPLGEQIIDEDRQTYTFDALDPTWRWGFVRSVRLRELPPHVELGALLDDLADLEIASLLGELRLGHRMEMDEDRGAFARSRWPMLTTLAIDARAWPQAALAGLLDGEATPSLTTLELRGHGEAGRLCEVLTRGPLAAQIQSLSIRDSTFDAASVQALCSGVLTQLQVLRLTGSGLPEDASAQLAGVAATLSVGRVEDREPDW